MKTLDINPTRVWALWEICQKTYLRHGRKLSFPANTDPKKTYQWRYLSAIVQKFDEWDLDDESIDQFVDVAVRHSKEKGLLRKGLAALHQSNVLELCYETLLQQENTNEQRFHSLYITNRWLVQQVADRDPISVLLERSDADAAPNIALWYQARKITELYMSLSKVCYRSLRKLEKDDDDILPLLPTSRKLYLVRNQFLADNKNLQKIKELFGSDWRNLCQ